MVWALPSPQFTSTAHGESAPGSEKLPRVKLAEPPSLEAWSAGPVTLGATFLTATVAVYSRTPPSLSLILPPTERVPLSLVKHVAEFVPEKAPYPVPQSNA